MGLFPLKTKTLVGVAVQSKVNDIINSAVRDQNHIRASNNCLEVLKSSLYRISITTNDALPRGNLKSVRTWISASLLHHTDCASALTKVNDTKLVTETLSLVGLLINITRNALSLLFSYDHFGNNTASWIPLRTERDGFLGPVKKSGIAGFKGGVPANLEVDVTVSKDGRNRSYKMVQDAVNAAPNNTVDGKRFVIRIKAGVYEEMVRVLLEKKNVVFLGDGIGHYSSVCPIKHHPKSSVSYSNQDSTVQGYSPHKCGQGVWWGALNVMAVTIPPITLGLTSSLKLFLYDVAPSK
ncbi:probable pectinesterase/pectinesterase inhibitor 51 [Quercus robur]|uniref:probable pectinesterase/pectinesterase inhibitor 51 n=1 Tax=Quercus robur TaxID=38942 RepID=UPI00216260BD|nr:probable pectinesterase/pectinesterase inhibitor 51 [Quercus robur]